jgi:hypothetical protein
MAVSKQKVHKSVIKKVEVEIYSVPVDAEDDYLTSLKELRELVSETSHLPPETTVRVDYGSVSVNPEETVYDHFTNYSSYQEDIETLIRNDDHSVLILRNLGHSNEEILKILLDEEVQREKHGVDLRAYVSGNATY